MGGAAERTPRATECFSVKGMLEFESVSGAQIESKNVKHYHTLENENNFRLIHHQNFEGLPFAFPVKELIKTSA